MQNLSCEITFICMIIKNHVHKKGFPLGLFLKQRLAASQKWPIMAITFDIILALTLKREKGRKFSRMARYFRCYINKDNNCLFL